MAKSVKKAAKKAAIILAPARTLNIMSAPVQNPRGIEPVYTNNASILFAAHDVRLLFTEITLSSPGQKVPDVEMRANLSMSHSHFKALVIAANQSLENIEKMFGEIPWPPKNQ